MSFVQYQHQGASAVARHKITADSYDMLINLNIACVRFVFINKFLQDLSVGLRFVGDYINLFVEFNN